MPHDHCPPSRRGHTWRELVPADKLPGGFKVDPALRICKHCRKLGHVNKQGVIHILKGTDSP